jgi:hypothetical protein
MDPKYTSVVRSPYLIVLAARFGYGNVIPTAVMVGALYLTLERQSMQLRLLKEGDWAGIPTMAVGLSALQTVIEKGTKTTGSRRPSSSACRSWLSSA